MCCGKDPVKSCQILCYLCCFPSTVTIKKCRCLDCFDALLLHSIDQKIRIPLKFLGRNWAIGPWGRKGPCASVKMWVIFRNFSSLKFSFTFFFKKCPSNVPEMVQKFQQSSINRSNRGRRFVQSLQLLRVLVIFEVHHHLKDAPGVSWRKS
jgi:hypothetical protein